MLLVSNSKVLILTQEDYERRGESSDKWTSSEPSKVLAKDYQEADLVIVKDKYGQTFITKNRWGGIGRIDGSVLK